LRVGQWFRYVTACVEIVCAGALSIPGLTGFAAVWLGTTMLFATAAHLQVLRGNPGGAVALLALSTSLAWLMRNQFLTLRERLP
jgi:hypothetical protein